MEIVGAATEQIERKELKTLHAFSNKFSIYRVPKSLRGSKEYAYTPQIVSNGPIHHGKEELKEMEQFLKLGKVSVEKCIAAERETKLRNYYADNFEKITTRVLCENGVA
uniref:Uncharacterized protein n=1 Tax=Salix viminalis TaxID=40686 RepID=A0A6N2M5N6_SALVM